MLSVVAKWRWNTAEREAWDRNLTAKPCPECGDPLGLQFSERLNRWTCRSYGQCELACG